MRRRTSSQGSRKRDGNRGGATGDLFSEQLAEVVKQAFVPTGGEADVVKPTAAPALPVEDRGRVGVPPVADGVSPEAFSPSPVQAPDAPAEVVEPRALAQDQAAVVEAEGADSQHSTINHQLSPDPLPARMLNEFVYCPRLFYYEHVEGVFVESADTVKGKALHKRVDKGSGAMPPSEAGKSEARNPKSESEKARGESEATSIENQNSKIENDTIHSRSVMLGSERLGE